MPFDEQLALYIFFRFVQKITIGTFMIVIHKSQCAFLYSFNFCNDFDDEKYQTKG